MGYDIKLVTLSSVKKCLVKNNKNIIDISSYRQDFKENEETYLSYNFNKFRDIWYPITSFGKTSENFANDLRKASEFLIKKKVIPEIPKELFSNIQFDGWSTDIRVFHWNIKRLLKICKDNPRCLVLADVDHFIHITEKDLCYDNYVLENTPPPIVEYFHHPLNGNMLVDTFEKARQIVIFLKGENNELYKVWEILAWKLQGSPHI